MKYIRTKYKVINTSDCKEGFLCNQKCWQPLKGYLVYEQDIVKQADTIEELCDEFCLEQSLQDIEHIWFLNRVENHKEFIQRYNQSKWCEKLTSGWQKEAINGYGAIYTDKGLIYVSKLNEKGNWELI